MGIVRLLSQSWKQLNLGEETSIPAKFIHSRHVADLRLILAVISIIISVASSVALLISFQHEVTSNWQDLIATHSWWIWVRIVFASIVHFFVGEGTIIGAVGVVAGGVLAWTYQAFRARLSVIAMLAEEITTLGRVMAITDWVDYFIALDDKVAAGETIRLSSQQKSDSFVFDSLIKDVQQLDHLTVANITSFYIHMKVTASCIRSFAEIQLTVSDSNMQLRSAITSVIYYQFLTLESARKAIRDLVEFEPIQAQNIITILLNELLAHGFLRDHFREDLRGQQLEARDRSYRQDVSELHQLVMSGEGKQWDRAKGLSAEMVSRLARVFPDE
jgi:hypothetical protein